MSIDLCAWSRPVPKRANPILPNLQHGGYSALALLPGEDPSSFKKLHRGVVAELRPQGRLEEDIVADIARLSWRKQNIANYQVTQVCAVVAEVLTIAARTELPPRLEKEREEQLAEAFSALQRKIEAGEKGGEAKKEAAASLAVVNDITGMATLNGLLKALEVQERLDGLIDRCLKRLLFIRGLKSLAGSAESPSAPPVQRRLPRRKRPAALAERAGGVGRTR
jgi:hypothetical protein